MTGASQGIGKATAKALVRAGYFVVLVGRDQTKLDKAAAEDPDSTWALSCDVADPQAVDQMYTAIHDRWGRLDLVFNTAGVSLPATEIGDLAWGDYGSCNTIRKNEGFSCSHL
ncbi:MAG: SDR family oxidoreductase [Paracoccus sp. (in: a-proteobacteria)]|uniref:SDR family oxidoreductase n=1 Tax=Paracoccus sp. TaxID=267 RepID=UPI00391C6596